MILKILDFGVAKIQDIAPESAISVASRPNNVIGTPIYVAPEQLLGHRADHRADLYVIGMVVFTLLTGKPAFEGDTANELADAILNRPLMKKPTSVASDLPHALDA